MIRTYLFVHKNTSETFSTDHESYEEAEKRLEEVFGKDSAWRYDSCDPDDNENGEEK